MNTAPKKSTFKKKIIKFAKPTEIADIPIRSITITKNNVSWKTGYNDGLGEADGSIRAYADNGELTISPRSKKTVEIGCQSMTEARLLKWMPLTYARHVMALLRSKAVERN